MAKAPCPNNATEEHFVVIPDDEVKVGKRRQCSRYGHRYKIVGKNPLELENA